MEYFYNAYCCVAPRYNPKRPTGYDAPFKDCPVYKSGDMHSSNIGYLSAGEHVEVLELGGKGKQYWYIKFDGVEVTEGEEMIRHSFGWVPIGCLEFFKSEEREAFVKEAKND